MADAPQTTAMRSPRSRVPRIGTVLVIAVASALGACSSVEPVLEEILPITRSPRERFEGSLERAGLGGSALLADWRASAEAALASPVEVPGAYRESVAVDLSGRAHAWRIAVRRGHRVRVELAGDVSDVFLDAHGTSESRRAAVQESLGELAHADRGVTTFAIEPDFDGTLTVRAQTRPLSPLERFTVEMWVEPSLAFPVVGGAARDIGSVFGDPRDGGGREHHGIDVFAARGTPVVAVAGGRVSRVETTPIGGRVVWMRAEGPGSVYYAHLDSQTVTEGQRVEVGDTVGLVGNTGNARTTPPHLHFGIYSRGPVDPMPFVRPIQIDLPELTGDTALVGGWVRTTSGADMRLSPSADSTLALIPSGMPLAVLGATRGWVRVASPAGRAGFLATGGLERADEPLELRTLSGASALRTGPGPESPVVTTLEGGTEIAVLARSDGAWWVRATASGATGWVTPAE